MRMPVRTPSRATPRKAVIDSRHSTLPCRHSRTVPGMSARESAAVMTMAARAGCGQVAEQAGDQHDHDRDEDGADDTGQLGLGAGALRHRGARTAGADREPLEQARGEVGGADADHFLVAVDLIARPGGERRRGGDRVGQGDECDAGGAGQDRADVRPGNSGDRQRRETLGQHAHQAHAVLPQVEDHRGGNREHDHDQDGRDLGQPTLEHQDQDDAGDADRSSGADRLAVGETLQQIR